MRYSVEYSEKAKKQLKKLDKSTQRLIVSWLKKNVEGSENPRLHGKALVGNLGGLWRYRVEDYRIIAKIYDDKYIVLTLTLEHRRQIYKRNDLIKKS